jgi:hypothetical protein
MSEGLDTGSIFTTLIEIYVYIVVQYIYMAIYVHIIRFLASPPPPRPGLTSVRARDTY